jgi:hypothetical protein
MTVVMKKVDERHAFMRDSQDDITFLSLDYTYHTELSTKIQERARFCVRFQPQHSKCHRAYFCYEAENDPL